MVVVFGTSRGVTCDKANVKMNVTHVEMHVARITKNVIRESAITYAMNILEKSQVTYYVTRMLGAGRCHCKDVLDGLSDCLSRFLSKGGRRNISSYVSTFVVVRVSGVEFLDELCLNNPLCQAASMVVSTCLATCSRI